MGHLALLRWDILDGALPPLPSIRFSNRRQASPTHGRSPLIFQSIARWFARDQRLCDLRGDGYPELLIVSHGGPIRLFENRKGHLEEATAQWGLDRWRGRGPHGGRRDVNGHLDLVAGNLGANTRWQVSRENPFDGILEILSSEGV